MNVSLNSILPGMILFAVPMRQTSAAPMMYLSSTGRTVWLIAIKLFHLPVVFGRIINQAVMSSKGPGGVSSLFDLSAQCALFQDITIS